MMMITSFIPAIVVCVGAVLHSIIAFYVSSYTTNDYAKKSASYTSELMMNTLFFVVIDAILSLTQVNRDSVRQFHWKINTVILVTVLVFTYSQSWMLVGVYMCAFCALMKYIYVRFGRERVPVTRQGLEKYIKYDPDYYDTSVSRNAKYVLITVVEGALIWNHSVSFISPILFVIVDAVWNRVSRRNRTKWSDLYVSIFTASMDTGLWMNLFNIESAQDALFDIMCLVMYYVLVHGVVKINNNVIQEVYDVINTQTRFACFVAFIVGSRLFGASKIKIGVFLSNLVSNMLFVYLSCDLLDKRVHKRNPRVPLEVSTAISH